MFDCLQKSTCDGKFELRQSIRAEELSMERKLLEDLLEWNKNEDRKPLLVLGARQVGKSYLIEELFAKKYYKDAYLRIDCSDDPDFVNFAFDNPSMSKVLDYIKVRYSFVPDAHHLLVFDEAQECLPIVQMMKHFCEKRRDIPLIVSGSLVRTRIKRSARKRGGFANKNFLFPVGKINQMIVYPMTFDEFLMNYKKTAYEYLRDAIDERKEIPLGIHEELMGIFNDYLFVGGMPEAVNAFISNKDDKLLSFEKSSSVINDIYENYLSDMELYQASPESIMKSRLVYRSVYAQLNKENRNFKCSEINKKYKTDDVLAPIEWLVTANVVNKAYIVKERVTSPLLEREDSLYRLYLSDMGLFTFQSGMDARTYLTNQKNALSGIFYENYVSTELVARGKKLFYWKGKRDSGLEFLMDIGGRIISIDVKKSKGSLHSIEEYRAHNAKDIVIKISSNRLGYDEKEKILTLPFYCLSFFLDAGFSFPWLPE